MMRFSRKVEYALIALVYMSRKPAGELTTARELSEKYKISLELIGKLLQNLARAGLIVSTQGVKGGYSLLQQPDEITIDSVIGAVDGPVYVTRCAKQHVQNICEREDFCNIRDTMSEIQKRINGFLGGISLKEFNHEVSVG